MIQPRVHNGAPGSHRGWIDLWDRSGAVLVEAAFALPVLVVLLLGIVTYGLWLTAASNLQHVANEAARATLGGVTDAERDDLAQAAIARSLMGGGLIEAAEVEADLSAEDGFYTVTLTYDAGAQALFATSLVPLPGTAIVRSASVEMTTW